MREAFSSKLAFSTTTTLASYLPKGNKNVILLGTLHKMADISGREDRKPDIILDYKHNKGGVDNLHRATGPHCRRGMTVCRPLVIFHNITDMSSYDALCDME